MSKRSLYIIILTLLLCVLVVLFMPQTKPPVTTPVEDAATTSSKTASSTAVAETQTDSRGGNATDTVAISGTFVSLVDGTNERGKTFKYMLLDDGTEIMRIDLRPLLDYSDLRVIEKLGVERGSRVEVVGYMDGDRFIVETINQLTPEKLMPGTPH